MHIRLRQSGSVIQIVQRIIIFMIIAEGFVFHYSEQIYFKRFITRHFDYFTAIFISRMELYTDTDTDTCMHAH